MFQKGVYIIRFFYFNGEGGIRNHGALADTQVFKTCVLLVIAINLIVLKEQISLKVHQLKLENIIFKLAFC